MQWVKVPSTESHGPYVTDENGQTVCDLYFVNYKTHGYGGKKIHTFENAERHADLIAAAPEMLEALKRVVDQVDFCSFDNVTRDAVNGTIAKAEGYSK